MLVSSFTLEGASLFSVVEAASVVACKQKTK
jgi:hypothetical protein